ncbi:MAG: DUF2330 domain-containing protein [Actinomycetota bacterium]
MRLLRAILVVLLTLAPQAALACGAMVSEEGTAELLGFEALLRWDGTTEELLVSVDYRSGDPTFGWLMPLPAAPDIVEGDGALIEEAFAITEPPIAEEEGDGEGAGAPPAVGGAPEVDVIGRDTVGGLRFVTLGAQGASDVARWMRKHDFGFHDRQEPVLQGYLDKGWVVVAARVAPGEKLDASLVPVSFTFPTPELTYPLAMAGAGHEKIDLGMSLFVLSPFRPASTTYPERVVEPDPSAGFGAPGRRLELRYSAPLGGQAERMGASPETWLTRYEANIPVQNLGQDLVLAPAAEQIPVDYSDLGDEDGVLVWVFRVAVVLVAAVLAIWISLGLARRRRSDEAPRMPSQSLPS